MTIRSSCRRIVPLFAVLILAAGCVAPLPVATSGGTAEAARDQAAATPVAEPGRDAVCAPTAPDMLGPFYVPGAPERNTVGEGYVLSGRVLDADSCEPIAGATLEFWMAGPDGEYTDAYRATWKSDADGAYSFSSSVPVPYAGRPPHIHIRVTANEYPVLVTQHYPESGVNAAAMDIVLAR
jgi:protocatechuate 3,4-dioxygenase beta subunit